MRKRQPVSQRRGASNTTAIVVAVLVILGLGAGFYVWLQRGQAASSQATPAVQQDATREQGWRQADPALVKYRGVGQIATGLLQPRGLALTPDQQQIVVVGDEVLRLLSWQGAVQAEWSLGAEPYCVAVAPDGTSYIGFRDHVETYSGQGQRIAQWARAGAKSYFCSVAVSGQDIYVGDAGQRVVLRYDVSGNVVGYIGQKDPARRIPGLVMPSPHLDVVVGPDGLLRVTNPGRRSVEVYDALGNLKASWGKSGLDLAGFSGCCNPTDLALLADGRVVTAEKGIPRVKVYSAAGAFESVVAPPDALSTAAAGMDLAVDSQGRVLVLDPPARAIRVFAPLAAQAAGKSVGAVTRPR
jgi:glucose/arabinose dehydrogenase